MACRMRPSENDYNLRVLVVSAMMAMLAAATAGSSGAAARDADVALGRRSSCLLAYAATLLARIPATYFSPILDDHSLMSGVRLH